MAFSSTFYDTLPGEGVKETTWAQSAMSRGALYGVVGADDFKISAHPTIPYAVNIGPGKAWGNGVFDDVTGTTAVTSATPAQGVTRWDLITIRRDWQPTGGGPSSFKAVSGTATQGIPSTRENRPGIVADQPLYLVQWVGGTTTPKATIDLRCWAGAGGVEIKHTLARSYLDQPGNAVKLGQSLWRFEPVGNSSWDWKEYQLTSNLPDFTSGVPAGKTPIVKFGFTHLANHDNTKVATNDSGDGYHYFPKAFPEALVSVIAMPANDPKLWDKVTENYHFNYNRVYSNNARFSVRVYNKDGVPIRNGSGIYITYIAIGY